MVDVVELFPVGCVVGGTYAILNITITGHRSPAPIRQMQNAVAMPMVRPGVASVTRYWFAVTMVHIIFIFIVYCLVLVFIWC